MLGWKKRDEGFEWHKYVRTTIKLRREARRSKAQKLGEQAAQGAKAASAAASGVAESGVRQLSSLARLGLATSSRLARLALTASSRLAVAGMGWAGRGLGILAAALGRGFEPLLHVVGRPGISGPLILAGSIATAAGLGRIVLAGSGLDAEALAALVTGLLCLGLGIGPSVWLGHSALPERLAAQLAALGSNARVVAGAAAFVALGSALWLAVGAGGRLLPSFPGGASFSFMGGGARIEGRASVMAADLIRISDTTVRLAGIEAPDRDQRCTRGGAGGASRGWACGEDARDALSRLVRGQPLKCEVGQKDAHGLVSGRCHAGATDIAEALVRTGHAFAETGLAATYRAAESEAQAARAGMWSNPEPERPATWRARLWAEAKRQAPDGCPIKGRVARGERIYLLPWTSDYAKARISKHRGERWFCSEDEAVAAGWRVGGRG